jgi:hypothetical protein
VTLYLIAHKVRGAAAFDVAEKLQIGQEEGWIITTSGHRAYPYWQVAIDQIYLCDHGEPYNMIAWNIVPPVPDSLPDHYSANDTKPPKPKSDLSLEDLGL